MDATELLGCQNLGPLSLPTRIVTDRALVARFEQSGGGADCEADRGDSRLTGVYFRDAKGRVREEYFQEGPDREPFLVKIYDPVADTALVLNPKERTGIRISLTRSGEGVGGGFLFPFARIDRVGEEEILGHHCSRYECTGGQGVEPHGRVWVAEDLGLVLREEVFCQNGFRWWSITTFDLAEPREEEFVAPEGFLVTDIGRPG